MGTIQNVIIDIVLEDCSLTIAGGQRCGSRASASCRFNAASSGGLVCEDIPDRARECPVAAAAAGAAATAVVVVIRSKCDWGRRRRCENKIGGGCSAGCLLHRTMEA